ncbi:hypothetical protein FRC09_015670 [Ceratobasidium sp. 395]|nr:hypothetical protein FRC09_015670 [Ceratobasidium sp. 395]
MASREGLYAQVSQLGIYCLILGAINMINPVPSGLNHTYGLVLCASGIVIQAEANRLRRCGFYNGRPNRYGPRGPYKKRNFMEDIERIFEDDSDRQFKSWARMSRQSFDRLLHLIKDDEVFKSKGRKPQVPVHYQLAAYLIRYGYETGSKTSSKIKVSEGATYKCCKRVTRALRKLRPAYVSWPTNAEKREIKLLYESFGFPGAIGAIDGTYFRLLDKPKYRSMSYYCRKKFYAINMLAVVDIDGRFIYYDIGWPGSVADVSIWKRSHLWLNRDSYLGPREWLMGDNGYTLTQYVITPFDVHDLRNVGTREQQQKRQWNKALSSRRMVVEHTFGLFKKRFAYLQGIRGRHMYTIYRVLESLIVLHNILYEFGDLTEDLGPEEAALVMRQQAEARLQADDRVFEAPVPQNIAMQEYLEIGEERRKLLFEHWLETRNRRRRR